jgi:CBS domain-containing protein
VAERERADGRAVFGIRTQITDDERVPHAVSGEASDREQPPMLIASLPPARDMDDIFVGRLMSSPVQTVAPESPIHDAAELMIRQDIGSLIVVDEGDHPEGILTSTDFVHLAADRAAPDTLVREYSTEVHATAAANDHLQGAADRMMDEGVHHLPVVDEDEGVIGILTSTDLTAYLSHNWKPSPA